MSIDEALAALLTNTSASSTMEHWISTVGFPIVAFFVLCFLVFYMMKQHTAESKEWQATLNRNSEALETLAANLKGDK